MRKSFDKNQKQYYANLNQKDVSVNKKLSKTVKPLLSDKIKSNEKFTLVEDEIRSKIFTQEHKVTEQLNSFFSKLENS